MESREKTMFWRICGELLSINLNHPHVDAIVLISPDKLNDMFKNMPNVKPGFKNAYNLQLTHWRTTYYLNNDEKLDKELKDGNTSSLLSRTEDNQIVELIISQILDKNEKISTENVRSILQLFFSSQADHYLSNHVFHNSWIQRFLRQHNSIKRRTIEYRFRGKQPELITADVLSEFMTESGLKTVDRLQTMLGSTLFQGFDQIPAIGKYQERCEKQRVKKFSDCLEAEVKRSVARTNDLIFKNLAEIKRARPEEQDYYNNIVDISSLFATPAVSLKRVTRVRKDVSEIPPTYDRATSEVAGIDCSRLLCEGVSHSVVDLHQSYSETEVFFNNDDMRKLYEVCNCCTTCLFDLYLLTNSLYRIY